MDPAHAGVDVNMPGGGWAAARGLREVCPLGAAPSRAEAGGGADYATW